MLDYYTRVGAVTQDEALFSATLWRCWNFGSTFASSGFGSRSQGKDGVVFTRGALRGSQKCVSTPPRSLRCVRCVFLLSPRRFVRRGHLTPLIRALALALALTL